jgi:hypothetical protein
MRLGGFLTDRLFVVIILLAIQLGNQAGYVFMGVYTSEYFTWGPNDRLFFVGAPIDTWTKWYYLIGSRLISVVSEAALGAYVKRWIETYVESTDKTYLPYAKWKCRLIVQIYAIYERLNEMFSLFLVLTQADVALAEILCQAFILQLWIMPRWLRRKECLRRDTTLEALLDDSSN